MDRISKFFTRSEVSCKCGCGFDSFDVEAARIADESREFTGEPITPTSACRCKAHNKRVRGAKGSYHLEGRAIDLPCKNPKALYDYLCQKYPNKYGFGLYDDFVHADSRAGEAARWVDAS